MEDAKSMVNSHLVAPMRALKHRAFIAQKEVRRATYPVRQSLKDALFRGLEKVHPYHFEPERYDGQFVAMDIAAGASQSLPRIIYCFWTGNNELTVNRRAALNSLILRNDGIEIRLVTPQSLPEFILPEAPLHPAYRNLSLVHRSDYLRCYFMNFWGGGYCDLKTVDDSWLPAFYQLEAERGKWALGYREVASDMTARLPGRLGRDIRRHYSLLIGNGAFIMKSQTPLTKEWYRRLLDRMDFYAEALARYPGNERGDNPGYPVPWIDILGNVLPPLALKYHDRLIHNDLIRPRFSDYR